MFSTTSDAENDTWLLLLSLPAHLLIRYSHLFRIMVSIKYDCDLTKIEPYCVPALLLNMPLPLLLYWRPDGCIPHYRAVTHPTAAAVTKLSKLGLADSQMRQEYRTKITCRLFLI